MRKKIYVFGNPLLEEDSLPVRLVPKLRKIFPRLDFIIQDPNENLKPEDGTLYIIDTIIVENQGSKVEGRIQVIKDLDEIQLDKAYSAHDFDLGFNLKLLAKIGKLKKIVIFGVPTKMSHNKALKQLRKEVNKEL